MPNKMVAGIQVFAKPGELMQGVLPDNSSFMLSNKSSRIFRSTIQVSHGSYYSEPLMPKSAMAAALFYDALNGEKQAKNTPLTINLSSNIPAGKGLSSSSTDILGIMQALNLYYNAGFSKEHLYKFATIIEPTDPCFHSRNLLFNQISGIIMEELEIMPYKILYFDSNFSEKVETLHYHLSAKYSTKQKCKFEKSLQAVLESIAQNDYPEFFECLMQSAEINNDFLPKRGFEKLLQFARENKCGLFIAHSGTYMGLVMHPLQEESLRTIAEEFILHHWDTEVFFE